jgi:hypothetical protein
MENNKPVNDFIKTKVLPEYRPIVETFRKLVKDEFPEISEEMRAGTEAYYGVPAYREQAVELDKK